MRWFLSTGRANYGDEEGYALCVPICVHGGNGRCALADTRPSGLSIIIIGVQAPRRIRSH